MSKLKPKKHILLLAAALALLLAAGALLFLFIPAGAAKGVAELPLKGKTTENFKIAVLSDSLLSRAATARANGYWTNTRSALALLKEERVALILFAGNMTAAADAGQYKLFTELLDEVYGEGNAPPVLAAMGAGELEGAATAALAQRTFAKALDQKPRVRVKIGAVQVIALSADRADAAEPYSAGALRWLENALAEAAKDAAGGPILVLTPCPPANTVQGSGAYGSAKLDALLASYSNAISLSGGTHRPQLDEGMIWQGGYTAVGSQGLSYVELEPGYFDPQQGESGQMDVQRPQQADARPFALILAVARNKITVQRWNVLEQAQEHADAPWAVFLPLARESFVYAPERRAAVNAAPYFTEQDIFTVSDIPGAGGKNMLDGVAFSPATDDLRVAAYDLEATSRLNVTTTRRCAADTFLGMGAAKKVALALDPTLPSGEYKVRVYAVDDFGVRSTNYLECKLTHTKKG